MKKARVLLLTPPMTQLNTPYPATAYLTGFLRSRGYDVCQADPSIDLACALFSRAGLERVRAEIQASRKKRSESVQFFIGAFEEYAASVDAVIRFLQGRDPSLAMRIAAREFLPEGPRFATLDEDNLVWAFGSIGAQDRAKHLSTLFIDDLTDVIRDAIDDRFSLSRYAEKLAASQTHFDEINAALSKKPTLIERILKEIAWEYFEKHRPTVLGLSVPFPGNVLGAFRLAQYAKEFDPKMKVIVGGGYANTELRSLAEPRVFNFVDFITLDDGERPFELILASLQKKSDPAFLRTFLRRKNKVEWVSDSTERDIAMKDQGTPTYDGLRLDRYLSILEVLNPMHRLWSDARWNKLTLAHGCYWKKCNFCDLSLDYINRYEPLAAEIVLDRMQSLIEETGQSGFHFVDEAAPPAGLRALSEGLIKRKMTASWWGNIRFEKSFTPELTGLMAKAGCIAVSGGLEVASDRLLGLMQKGVSVAQVARVTRAFREAGILVHAYLMYGFPTENEQETVDSLERVRQLFASDCLQSAYWHRFSATAHSPIGQNPEKFGIRIFKPKSPKFAINDLDFEDPTGCDHDRLGPGLQKAVFNYMHGIGLDEDVRAWFEHEVPRTSVPKNFIAKALQL